MICALCGATNPEDAAYCIRCGVALGLICPHCGATNNPRAARCGACGTAFQADKPVAGASRAPRESRRIVTALFADIVGYTALVETNAGGTETIRAMLQDCFDRLSAVILDQGGIVEKFIGDAICALFGAPVVHEDDPQRALACAIHMQEVIELINNSRSEIDGAEVLSLKIGVSTGEVVGGTAEHAGQQQYSVTGDAVNTASRLQAAAQPGQILVSAATQRLARERFIFEAAQAIKLKGKRTPVETFVLIGVREDGARRGGVDLVNRRRELEQLSHCLTLASERDPQTVEIIGDAGVGKSRLVDAFLDQAGSTALVCRGTCPPLAVSSLHPFRSIAGDLLTGLSLSHGERASALDVLTDLAHGSVSPDIDEPVEAAATAIYAALRVLSQSCTILLAVENVHRADPDSLDLLQRLVTRARDERLMIAWSRRAGEEMIIQADYSACYTRISLKPLSDRDAEILMLQLLGATTIPSELQRLVVDRSGGNPLFIEAMVRTLLDDATELGLPDAAGLEVPTTVRGLIQARLDSLPEDQRLVAQQAAVAGREFDARLLQAVDLFGLNVLPALDALARRGMIEHVGGTTYRFHHVLAQEVCYDTMLQGLRSELHREIADAMPEMFPDRVSELAPARADHYAKAGDTDRAVEVLVEAGGAPEA